MATVLITGANRGIGLELVRTFTAAGWTVLACCRNPKEAVQLTDLALKHSTLEIHPLDVKNALAKELNKLMEPVRKNTKLPKLHKEAYS